MNDKEIELCGFTFVANFDSANLSRVEYVPRKPIAPPESPPKTTNKKQPPSNRFMQKRFKTAAIEFPDYEFNIWTNPDCSGTEFENSNRSWFHFGVRGGTPYSLVKLNIVDLNKQSKMYGQGMAPVFKISPGRSQWERIHDRPVFTSENNVFTLSFKFRALENAKSTTYFAFTYPFSYTELQSYLSTIDVTMSKPENHLPKAEIRFNKGLRINNDINDAIYYHRETLCYSLEYRNVDLITISSHHNITAEREPRIEKLFPNENQPRPFKFQDKKVIFMSARVHPGETPSSFVLNGFLNLLVQKDDPIAILLRRQYVFKLIPMLNPDGVARGHYRTDTRGCNLNRFYLNPSPDLHPSIYAARALIRYYHYGSVVPDSLGAKKLADESSQADPNDLPEMEGLVAADFGGSGCGPDPKSDSCHGDAFVPTGSMSSGELASTTSFETTCKSSTATSDLLSDTHLKDIVVPRFVDSSESLTDKDVFLSSEEGGGGGGGGSLLKSLVSNALTSDERTKRTKSKNENGAPSRKRDRTSNTWKVKSARETNFSESGLFLYVDMHGHASKKGIFMYGNHFDKVEDSVECMLLPKIMSVNSQNFHFPACNFTEKNMYLRDKRDGTSREGSGRVAVLRLTGLIRSYTLECNYNTGRFVNVLPQCSRDLPGGKGNAKLITPPKYTPVVFEEIGRSLAVSILDLTNSNPWSRIPNSEYHTLFGVRDWLRLKTLSEGFLVQRGASRTTSMRLRSSAKSSQTQVMMGVLTSERKHLPNVRLAPVRYKATIEEEEEEEEEENEHEEESERKENLTSFQGTSKSSGLLGRRQSTAARRSINRVANVLQVVHRSGTSRPHRTLAAAAAAASKKSNFRGVASADKVKFKQFARKADHAGEDHAISEGDARMSAAKVSVALNSGERERKIQSVSDPCIFKQGPKRLKISKVEAESGKLKVTTDWAKEDAVPGPSSEMIVYSRISRPMAHLANANAEGFGHGKKRTLKRRSQLSAIKYKKSLGGSSEPNKKKIKTLFKKAAANRNVLSASEIKKNIIETKRRKN